MKIIFIIIVIVAILSGFVYTMSNFEINDIAKNIKRMFGIETLQALGYMGAFLSGFFSTFTLFLPSPTFVVVFLLASSLNPFYLGILGGIGAAIGEMIGYGVGCGVLKISLQKKHKKIIMNVKKWFLKYRPSVIIFIFSAMPVLPFDLVGIFCGMVNYDKKRFFVVTLLGKLVKYLFIAYAGYYGMHWINDMFFD